MKGFCDRSATVKEIKTQEKIMPETRNQFTYFEFPNKKLKLLEVLLSAGEQKKIRRAEKSARREGKKLADESTGKYKLLKH